MPRLFLLSPAALLLVVLSLSTGCAEPAPSVDVAQARAEWDAWVADREALFQSDSSPLPDSSRGSWEGVPYFEFDSTFVVAAALSPASQADTLFLATNTGELRPMVPFGTLAFQLEGRAQRLTAYVPLGPIAALTQSGRLFVPFRDATTGRETYGGGRYLDLAPAPDGQFVIDFNQAYHPTCVYTPTFSCPIPPPENTLEVAVTAGERFAPNGADI